MLVYVIYYYSLNTLKWITKYKWRAILISYSYTNNSSNLWTSICFVVNITELEENPLFSSFFFIWLCICNIFHVNSLVIQKPDIDLADGWIALKYIVISSRLDGNENSSTLRNTIAHIDATHKQEDILYSKLTVNSWQGKNN